MATLVNHYLMNNNANDNIAGGTNGTTNGITYTTTNALVSYSAVYSNSDTNYITVGASNGIFANSDSWSISVWARIDDTALAGSGERVLTLHRGSSAGSAIAIDFTNSGQVQVYYYTGSSGSYVNVGAYSVATWCNIIVTYDGTTCYAYLNNGSPVTIDSSGNFSGFGTYNAFIGHYYNGSGVQYAWDGLIDDVRFYDGVLTATDRSNIYNSGSGTESESFGSFTGAKVCNVANASISKVSNVAIANIANINKTG